MVSLTIWLVGFQATRQQPEASKGVKGAQGVNAAKESPQFYGVVFFFSPPPRLGCLHPPTSESLGLLHVPNARHLCAARILRCCALFWHFFLLSAARGVPLNECSFTLSQTSRAFEAFPA